MHKICSINIRPEDRESIEFLKSIIENLSRKGVKVLLPEYKILAEAGLSGYISNWEQFRSQPDLVISLGGDGTLLHTVRLVPDGVPVFSINKGRLGFLTEFMPDEALNYLDKIINKEYKIEERDMLEITHMRGSNELSRIPFLNDVAVSRGVYSRPITMFLEIDGKPLNYFSGDGLIVSTTTGSTAYSLSAGGPIINPVIKGIFLIMPICPHTLAMRPLIIPGNSILKIRLGSDFSDTVMTVDGHDSISVHGDDELFFSSSRKKAGLIAHPDKNFYEVLKQKFSWGKQYNAF
ncbi:MAG: NAD(+)/NADH kinase [Spirochaetes bacterium]|nr:NAD(+)/NADH kinase [Spirochaetota bacterium]